MLVNQSTISQLEAFNKYARFISEQFGVIVRFDGLKACTDGKVIYLPSLSGMSEDEIEFLYCVLLHEVGHIRYSLFTPESFSVLKTEAHFSICNALEDARIENLLMKDFDGAHEIFEKLYKVYSTDDKFMKRVFGIKNKEIGLWNALGIYCHDYFIDLDKKKTLEEIVGSKLAKQVQKFIDTHSLDKVLEKTDLNTWDDVVELGTKIYKMFFGEFPDKSKKVDITPMVNALDKVEQDGFTKLDSIAKEMNEKLEKLQEKYDKLAEKVKESKAANYSEISQLEKEQKESSKLLDGLESLQDLKKTLQSKTEKVNKYNEQKTEFTNKKSAYEEKQKALNEQLNEQKTKDGEEVVSKKQEQLKEKLKTVQERLNKLDEKIKAQDKKIEDQSKVMNSSQEELNKLPPELQQLPPEALDKMVKDLDAKLKEVEAKLEKLTSFSKDEMEMRSLREEIRQSKQQSSEQTTKMLEQLQEELNKAGIPIELIPQFQENPAWADGDEAQKEFDSMASDQTGQIVNNGCGFSLQSPRDIITYIDKVKNDVSNFDLGEHFYESNHESKLESFNEETSQLNNTKELSDGKTFKSNRRHTALSTQYDKFVNKNHSDGKELTQLKIDLAKPISQVKNLFRTHLRFDKKDYFKGNQEEGRLDSRNLWKLATKTDDLYYEVNKPKFINKASAAIVMDISGSMDKDFTEHGKKLKELSLILSEGLKEVHIQHEVIGFHAPVSHDLRSLGASPVYNRNSNSLEHIVYKTFNDRNNNGIQNIDLQCSDNSDGESLKSIGTRLMKSRSKRKVMFVITDGKPFLSDADVSLLDQDLKNTVLWCKQNKIELFAFGFNEQGREFYGDRFCMINNYEDLIKFIKEKL